MILSSEYKAGMAVVMLQGERINYGKGKKTKETLI